MLPVAKDPSAREKTGVQAIKPSLFLTDSLETHILKTGENRFYIPTCPKKC